jgi:hypothetical protein
MRRSDILAMLLLCGSGVSFLTAGRSAQAHDGPLCNRPEILSFAMEHLKQGDAHVSLVANSAIETETPRANVVMCAVTVRVSMYDPIRPYAYPAVVLEPRYFAVTQLGDGLEVDFTGK